VAVWVLAILCALAAAPAPAVEPEPMAGEEIVRRVNARDDGRAVARTLTMELVEPGGAVRTRVTRSFRRDFADERRLVMFFEEPPNLKGTALLSWDRADPSRDDEQWLYLPALRKARRVAVSERGRAFLGTDLSFEEMKKETRLAVEDYHWRTLGEETVDGHRCHQLEATPVDDETREELGYGRVLIRVDAELWIPRWVEYWDPRGEPIKTVRLLDVREVQGIWTAHRVEVANPQSGHRTVLQFAEVDYAAELPEDLFRESSLARGAP
jgi:outer membrane lipoprotein-sorting protein